MHDLRHRCRWLLSLALLELCDFVAVVGMVRVVGVEEIKLGIVDLILPNPSFKLGSVSVKWQQSLVYHQITHL